MKLDSNASLGLFENYEKFLTVKVVPSAVGVNLYCGPQGWGEYPGVQGAAPLKATWVVVGVLSSTSLQW